MDSTPANRFGRPDNSNHTRASPTHRQLQQAEHQDRQSSVLETPSPAYDVYIKRHPSSVLYQRLSPHSELLSSSLPPPRTQSISSWTASQESPPRSPYISIQDRHDLQDEDRATQIERVTSSQPKSPFYELPPQLKCETCQNHGKVCIIRRNDNGCLLCNDASRTCVFTRVVTARRAELRWEDIVQTDSSSSSHDQWQSPSSRYVPDFMIPCLTITSFM